LGYAFRIGTDRRRQRVSKLACGHLADRELHASLNQRVERSAPVTEAVVGQVVEIDRGSLLRLRISETRKSRNGCAIFLPHGVVERKGRGKMPRYDHNRQI